MIEQLKTVDLKNMFQRFVKDFVRVLEDNPDLDYVFVNNISIPTGPGNQVTFNHLLGRQPIGWYITDLRQDGAAAAGNVIRRLAWNDKTLTLENLIGFDVIINVKVF